MPVYSSIQKKRLASFVVATIVAFTFNMIPYSISTLHGTVSFIYMGIIIGWELSVERRITHSGIRRKLILAAIFMILLFVMRLIRYCFYPDSFWLKEYAWYFYYVSFTAIPLIAYLVATSVGEKETDELLTYDKCMIIAEILLCLAVLTNRLHGWLFYYTDYYAYEYSRGILYYVVIVWETAFTIAAFVTMMRRCSISVVHKYWYVPAIPVMVGALLMVLYYIVDGSPMIFGYKLYNIQEVFCFTYISLFEGCIRIGLIPSNSGYDDMFRLSHVGAIIRNSNGNTIFESQNNMSEIFALYSNATDRFERERTTETNDKRLREKAISGGKILWVEDVTVINTLNYDLRVVTEQIEEENDLMEQEKRVAKERSRYETQNRLYDEIAEYVRPQVVEISQTFQLKECDEEEFCRMLRKAVVLGVYIKRKGNFILLSEENEELSTEELALAIRESFEYLTLSDVYTRLEQKGTKEISAGLIMLAYDLFEEVIEETYSDLQTILVTIYGKTQFCMEIAISADHIMLQKDWKQKEICSFGAELSISCEDDTFYIRLSVGREEVRV